VRAAIELRRRPPGPLAIRLDSGDLAALSVEARRMLDGAGLHDVRIVVSGGLDAFDLERLVAQGASIDAAGVGTRVGVSTDAPSLESATRWSPAAIGPCASPPPGRSRSRGASRRGGARASATCSGCATSRAPRRAPDARRGDA
jgi:nicotinate phosphoribosyltransferase